MLCKMWHVPANHDIFKQLSEADWLWYWYNFLEDQDESFTQKRDLVEYLASFTEPDAVRKIRESRDEAIEIPDDEFKAGIKMIFGRDFNVQKRKVGKIEAVDPTAVMSKYKTDSQLDNKISNISMKGKHYKHWLNAELE